MTGNGIDLMGLFSTVATQLEKNKTRLNEADDYNKNHGDNMVEIFKVIGQAMEERAEADPADQLAYASELLRQKSSSGSAALYADGLAKAASQLSGGKIDADQATAVLRTLLTAGEDFASGKAQDTLQKAMSGLASGNVEDIFESIDTEDLISAGLAFMQDKQGGASTLEALSGALVASGPMSKSQHRAQSAALVAQTVLGLLSGND